MPGATPMHVEVESLDMLRTSRVPVVVMEPAVYSKPRSAALLALNVNLQPLHGTRLVSNTFEPSAVACNLSKLRPA